MKTSVIIPALNEENCIGDLVTECLRLPVAQVIVVDNGSRDNTADAALDAGAEVVHEPRRGYGFACAAGVAAAHKADVLVFLDGDFSFLPSEMPALLAALQDADLVLGSRPRGHIARGAMPAHQRFGNWLVARLAQLFYGVRLTDVGPYRAIRRHWIERLDLRERTYGWPIEMIVKAAKRGARIVEVPVSYHPRRGGRSKVSGTWRGTFLASYHILRVTIRNLF
ncbi:MAG: glycosyltransferase family 2 protein [Chloroflexi bacterium]|nr:glycosyltransferase family 2 protein [Chloroflexota bacterium]